MSNVVILRRGTRTALHAFVDVPLLLFLPRVDLTAIPDPYDEINRLPPCEKVTSFVVRETDQAVSRREMVRLAIGDNQ